MPSEYGGYNPSPEERPSPPAGRYGASPGGALRSADKASGVQRTLKSQVTELELRNKQLSKELDRTQKELSRKGGGAGEGVHWFSASTMKTKLKQMESQWQRDLERRLSQSEAEAAAHLAGRLAEQAQLADSHWGGELAAALGRQRDELEERFEREASCA